MKKIAYLATDLHANNCTLGQMNASGAWKIRDRNHTCSELSASS
jgi:hypothetical protein